MGRLLAIVVFGSVTAAQTAFIDARPQQTAVTQSDSEADPIPADMPALPPAPHGKSTVIGGEIRKVDPLRDQFTLAVFGGRPITILFDARTELYRDGIKVAPGDLRTGERASVQTVLDGSAIFALSVRMLSRPPEGDIQGQVVRYNPGTREITISGAMSHEKLTIFVPAGTPVIHEERAPFSPAPSSSSDLAAGVLVSITFSSGHRGPVATEIAIVATPGSACTFTGEISSLDLHSGRLVLVDAHDDKNYEISFDPAHFPMSRNLHQGDQVTVIATFDGARYVATSIMVS